MADNASGLVFYSLGVVVNDKADGSDVVQVWPTETLSMESGKLNTPNRGFKSSLPDAAGVKKTAEVKGGSYLTARWIADGNDNRDTSPDVVKGETIKIFRYADTEKYYWTTLMREPKLRRLEHVRYNYSNQPSGTTPCDSDSSYYTEVSTKEQHIRIRTASNNGEPCRYDVKIDTKKGTFLLEDDLGNKLFLDSVAGKLIGKINESIGLKSKKIHLEADEINLKGKTIIEKLTLSTPLVAPGGVNGSELIEDFNWD